MGFRAFSVAPAVIPYLAATISHVNLEHAQKLVQQVCSASDSQQVRALLELPADKVDFT